MTFDFGYAVLAFSRLLKHLVLERDSLYPFRPVRLMRSPSACQNAIVAHRPSDLMRHNIGQTSLALEIVQSTAAKTKADLATM